jgi:hypothetical protein
MTATAYAHLPQGGASPLQRYLARGQEPPVEYRALRFLEARNAHFGVSAWMEAWTEFTHANGFRYDIVAEGGSGYVRNRVLRAALDGEQKMWAARQPERAAVTMDNYVFTDSAPHVDGLAPLGITPRRKDVLLVDGSIFVEPGDGELRRIEGRLSKSPSFWTRRVDIVRHYDRIGGVRVPIAIESVAHVMIAGQSTFKMTYQYETINGQRVGEPQPKRSRTP